MPLSIYIANPLNLHLIDLCYFCQVHVCFWRILWDAAQRCACLPPTQLPGLCGRGELCAGWARGPLHLEQRPLLVLGA